MSSSPQPSAIPLKVSDLTVAYQRKPVLWDVEFEVPAGSLVGIIGPNGAGKSTLLKAVLGLVPSVSGRIEIFGGSYRQHRARVGYVPQRESVDWDFPIDVLDIDVVTARQRVGRSSAWGLGISPIGRSVNFPAVSSNGRFWLEHWCRRRTFT
jgi:manganese/zinc/iron transport system ATP- binding protein